MVEGGNGLGDFKRIWFEVGRELVFGKEPGDPIWAATRRAQKEAG